MARSTTVGGAAPAACSQRAASSSLRRALRLYCDPCSKRSSTQRSDRGAAEQVDQASSPVACQDIASNRGAFRHSLHHPLHHSPHQPIVHCSVHRLGHLPLRPLNHPLFSSPLSPPSDFPSRPLICLPRPRPTCLVHSTLHYALFCTISYEHMDWRLCD